jgi:uncharacterized protein DUF4255/carboxypeptidase family protein
MAMQSAFIDDLSGTLKAVLKDNSFATMFPELHGAAIIFDRPSDTLAPAQTSVDLFLYDIRENLDLRLNEVTSTRVGNQIITHPAPLRLACSYLATAWPVGGVDLPLQEQRLLSQVLVVLSHYPMIPNTFLQGTLFGQAPPLPMVALHPDALKNLAEFWSSLGTKIKPSLTVTVTISVPVFSDVPGFIVTTENIGVAPGQRAPTETLLEIGGKVVDPLSHGIPGALVDVLDAGLTPSTPSQNTDSNGQFVFPQVNAGNYQLRAIATGFKPQVQPVTIPGMPNDYVIQLTPL